MPRAVHPAEDNTNYSEVTFNGTTFRVKRRFPMIKFMKTLENNPLLAITMLVHDEDVEKFEEIEFGFDEIDDLLTTVQKALGVGENQGN